MYEKKINILNQFDRELSHESFKYNVLFASLTIVIIFMLLFIKKPYYYQNIIDFKDNQNATIMVNKSDADIIKNHNTLIFNNLSMKYNIEKIEEMDDAYLFSIHFDIGVSIKSNIYKILLYEESLFKYVTRIIGG